MTFLKWLVKRIACFFVGHRYETDSFCFTHLYFCERCNREMFGRSFDDLREMLAEETDDLYNDFDSLLEFDHEDY